MSGHSKWATIKHKKGALDAKRGKIFTRLLKEIAVAAKGGGNPDSNARLRTAVLAAKAENMPQDNIKRAIQRGTGELEGVNYEEITFEGYGPGGVAIIVDVLTDNRNRAVSEIRHAFSKNGGNLGESGSVRFMFSQEGPDRHREIRSHRRAVDGHRARTWRRRPERRRRHLGDHHRPRVVRGKGTCRG
jgi:YebC/PmpR family DNA-binding regulatory protein